MNWTTEKPTVPGYYAWREIGEKTPYKILSIVYMEKEKIYIRLDTKDWKRSLLNEIADREWLGPLPE